MAAMQTNVRCNQCGFDQAINEINIHTQEEHTFCPACGRIEERKRALDSFGRAILKDGRPFFDETVKSGQGAYWMVTERGHGNMGAWGQDPRLDLEEFVQVANEKYDPDRCYLTRWDPDESKVEILYGEEFFKERFGAAPFGDGDGEREPDTQ